MLCTSIGENMCFLFIIIFIPIVDLSSFVDVTVRVIIFVNIVFNEHRAKDNLIVLSKTYQLFNQCHVTDHIICCKSSDSLAVNIELIDLFIENERLRRKTCPILNKLKIVSFFLLHGLL